MRLPGFSAAESLRETRTCFRTSKLAVVRAHETVAAQLRAIGNPADTCFSWCFLNGGTPLQCFFACGPGQLGGPQFSAGLLA